MSDKPALTNEFSTTDIVLASTLICYDVPLKRIDVVGRMGTFVFDKVLHEDFHKAYDLGRARVEPVAFNNAIKRLTTSVRRMVNG